jgi:hypothetical protein
MNDQVMWTKADNDVPKGSIGLVHGFTEERVRVRFASGDYWDFKPAELVRPTSTHAEVIYVNGQPCLSIAAAKAAKEETTTHKKDDNKEAQGPPKEVVHSHGPPAESSYVPGSFLHQAMSPPAMLPPAVDPNSIQDGTADPFYSSLDAAPECKAPFACGGAYTPRDVSTPRNAGTCSLFGSPVSTSSMEVDANSLPPPGSTTVINGQTYLVGEAPPPGTPSGINAQLVRPTVEADKLSNPKSKKEDKKNKKVEIDDEEEQSDGSQGDTEPKKIKNAKKPPEKSGCCSM